MYNLILMQILQTEDDTTYEELNDMLWECLVLSDLEAEVSTWHVVHDEVEV